MRRPSRALVLSGSRRGDRSNSRALARFLAQGLRRIGWIVEETVVNPAPSASLLREIRAAVLQTHELVLTFPLHCDSLPSPLLATLEDLRDRLPVGADRGARPGLSAIASCGFPDASECTNALLSCQAFAHEAGFEWRGGVAVGMGEAIRGRPLHELGRMGRPVTDALDRLCRALDQGIPLAAQDGILGVRPAIPVWLYTLVGNAQWRFTALRRGTFTHLFDRPY